MGKGAGSKVGVMSNEYGRKPEVGEGWPEIPTLVRFGFTTYKHVNKGNKQALNGGA